MKTLYWRPRRVSRIELTILAVLAIAGFVVVESFPLEERQDYYQEKLAAARLARTALEVIKVERLNRGLVIDPEMDPLGTGIVGDVISDITSGSGSLASKQTSVNPNFAALLVHWLTRLDIKKGDRVAVAVSGSFPALNIASYAALKSLGAEPVIISSVAASQWGANDPAFNWLDMERVLFDRGIFPFRSVAASRGGVGDRGLGLSKSGRAALDAAIKRNELPAIESQRESDNVVLRMETYSQFASGKPFRAFVNVGGGTLAVGTRVGKKNFRPGINRRAPRMMEKVPSLLGEFIGQGVPVIHVTQIQRLAEQYGLPSPPTKVPSIGEGKFFVQRQPNPWLAGTVLFALLLAVLLTFRSPGAGWLGLRRASRSGDKAEEVKGQDDQPPPG